MTDTPALQIVFTWRPHRLLERVETCLEGIEVHATDDRDEMRELLRRAEVACVGTFDAELLGLAKNLCWVHAMSGGVESFLFPEMLVSPIPFTCCKGCFAIPGAEHAMAAMLAFCQRLDYDIQQRPQRTFEWHEPLELRGKTLGIIGLGSMGREIAKKAHCFDMSVVGLARRPERSCPYVERFFAPQELHQLLAMSDFVVVSVPLTPETSGIMGAAELRAMKATAYLVDISGRPALYDLDALRRALDEGWIAGANMQMIPAPDSPLWEVKNLLISFHRSTSREQYDRCFDLFCENLRRYRAGQPLLGLVDRAAGY
jgi:phosphoglycerate dehydrogenase-like enzyme